MDSSVLIWGFLFSTFGLGFFMYGKKQGAIVPLSYGLLLMVYPYFISNLILLIVIGVVLMALPYFFRY